MSTSEASRRKLKALVLAHARRLSAAEGNWRVVYKVRKHGCPPRYRSAAMPSLDASPRRFPGGWKGTVVAAFLGGEKM